MAELKTKVNDLSVTDFINSVENETRRKDCFTLIEMMTFATGAQPKIWGTNIVGFGMYDYKYATGRTGSWPLVAFSPRKQNLTIYIMSGFEQYDALLKRLGKHSLGKSCLYVKHLSDLDLDTLKTLITLSVDHMKATNPTH